MNKSKLKAAEKTFLKRYPGGFAHPDMVEIGKKHKVDKLTDLARNSFAKKNFSNPELITQEMSKIVSRSSLVSMFEKPKFRDLIAMGNPVVIGGLSKGLRDFLYGDQKKGFETIVDVLLPYKLAKWSLVTVIPNYVDPAKEVFVKPTTAKGVIEFFELDGLVYKPRPTWEFYEAYRSAILDMQTHVDASLWPSNAAFGGFLMMSMEG